jgi:hypothetical protein
MSLSQTQLQSLKNELNTDPNGYGYATDLASGNDASLVEKINLKRDGTNGGPLISVRRPSIRREELLDAIDTRDLKANPSILEGSILESILQTDTIALANPDGLVSRTRQNLNRLLLDTNQSQTRLSTLATEVGSRAQQLFGYTTVVSDIDIANAKK